MVKLLLGSGKDRRSGWISVDRLIQCNPHIVGDLTTVPWPWDDNSVDCADADNLLEHIGWGLNGEDLLMGFMNEAHRVIRSGGTFSIRVPDFSRWPEGAMKDPTHRRYFVAASFDYWRDGHQTHKNYGSFYGYKPWRISLKADGRFLTAIQQPVK